MLQECCMGCSLAVSEFKLRPEVEMLFGYFYPNTDKQNNDMVSEDLDDLGQSRSDCGDIDSVN